ncbi:hypothetical protein [Rothia terrae]|uniref:Uncharacterized protein n=1 Tax=Rothia terrae TaxID=396015 RepID=A0A7S6WX94_9MICC|nr:hypothetical protein [Rothia terrae]QOW64762.1 hypothetical protein IDM49_11780 [Rothia terrae]
MNSNMGERLKAAQAKKNQKQNAVSVENTFKSSKDVSKKETKKFTFNLDADLYQKLRREAFEKETDMTSLMNSYLRQALQ